MDTKIDRIRTYVEGFLPIERYLTVWSHGLG